MHEVLVNGLGGLSLPRKSVVRLTDRPDMTLDVYRGRKTTIQQQLNYLTHKTRDFEKNKSPFLYIALNFENKSTAVLFPYYGLTTADCRTVSEIINEYKCSSHGIRQRFPITRTAPK